MKRISIFLFASILLSVSSANAQLDYQEIDISVMPNGDAVHKVSFTFSDNFAEFHYPVIGATVSNFTFSGEGFNADCSSNQKSWGSDISCAFSDITAERYQLVINFDSSGLAERYEDGATLFVSSQKFPIPPERVFIRLSLPEGSVILDDSSAITDYPQEMLPIFPSDFKISSDGRKIMLYLQKENISAGETLDVGIGYESVSSYGSSFSATTAIIFIFAAAMIAGIAFLGRKGKETGTGITSILNNDERAVISAIKEKGEKNVNQKAISKTTGFSKPKISRLLKDLESRGIVEREQFGRTNLVKIKKDLNFDLEQK